MFNKIQNVDVRFEGSFGRIRQTAIFADDWYMNGHLKVVKPKNVQEVERAVGSQDNLTMRSLDLEKKLAYL